MYAYVHFNLDQQFAKLPITFIKKFDPSNYDNLTPYKVFWSREIQALQKTIEDPLQKEKLKSLEEPPPKCQWNPELGDGYYWANVLRVENTLDELDSSIIKKRPTLRPCQTFPIAEEILTTTEDEGASFLSQEKCRKRFEEAEIKKKEKESKKVKANSIFKAAKRARNDTFEKLNNNTDLENVEYTDPPSYSLNKKIKILEKENQSIRKKYEEMEVKYFNLQKECNSLKAEVEEVAELRALNRQLQEEILKGGFSTKAMPVEMPVETEPDETEVNLGATISIDRKVYNEIFALDHVRKFTKSLAVAVWGTEVLACRSVKGRVCRNKNGPKKVIDARKTLQTNESKPPLTPEKLSVISDQMRKYLDKKGASSSEKDNELKKRNKYLSDKIQDILANLARSKN